VGVGFARAITNMTAIAVLLTSACGAPDQPSTQPSSAATENVAPSPSTEPSPTQLATATPNSDAPTPQAVEFVRWRSRDVKFFSEPGGDESVGSSNIHDTAAVVDRTVVDGVEWIRVQHGFGNSGEFGSYGWAPSRLDGLGATYVPYFPTCPDHEPTLSDTGGMPLAALMCWGSRAMTFSPVYVRNEGVELSEMIDGSPDWLTLGTGLVAHWLPDNQDMGSIRIYNDPANNIYIPEHAWVELTGQLDYPSAKACSITSNVREILDVARPEEAALWCRGHFVVTGVRALADAEIPAQSSPPTPGPKPDTTLTLAARQLIAPLEQRVGAASVWTGSEVILSGGWHLTRGGSSPPRASGAAYSPTSGVWREISPAPMGGRYGQVATWTGSVMLVWGGTAKAYRSTNDVAAYDPAADHWTELSTSPIAWSPNADSAWTGNEWWVAATTGGHRIHVAAYEPISDKWRMLPDVDGASDAAVQVVWTGSEIFVVSAGGSLARMAPAASEWKYEPVDMSPPVVWTGALLLGTREDNTAIDPLQWDPFHHPVAWDPATEAVVDIPMPPRSVFNPIWTGNIVMYKDEQLAFDPFARQWLRLDVRNDDEVRLERYGAAEVWAGDRLLVWGGWSACPGYSSTYEVGYELVVQQGRGAAGPSLASGQRDLIGTVQSPADSSDLAARLMAC
jgi:hypothetical protein